MTEPTQEPPAAPDGSELTPEEWDAVRRLRGERSSAEPAAPIEPPPPTPPGPTVPPAEPVPVQPVAAEPEPVEPEPAPVEPEPEPLERVRAERAPARALPAVVAAVALAVAIAVLAALVGLKASDNSATNSASTGALAAATSGVATVLSYNYKSLDADFAKAEALLTPKFRKLYDATTAKGVKPLAAKYNAVSTAQVEAAGGISASPSKATVLVFVSQQVTNSQLSAPRLDRSRIQVELVKSHGRWLIDKLTPL